METKFDFNDFQLIVNPLHNDEYNEELVTLNSLVFSNEDENNNKDKKIW